jgi:hypothetical protein
MQQQKALHLESDVGVDGDSQPIENAGPWRFQVAILDGESVLDDGRRDGDPEVNHVGTRQFTDVSSADKFMTGNGFHGASAARNFPAHFTSIWLLTGAGQRLR